MIIGEHNLIIGTRQSVVSSTSISEFFHFEETVTYIIKKIKIFFYKINPRVNSPPFYI